MHRPCFSLIMLILSLCPAASVLGQGKPARTLSGVVMTQQNEVVPGLTVLVRSAAGEAQVLTDAEGRFRLVVPEGTLTVKFFGRSIALISRMIGPGEASENLQIKVAFVVPPIHASVVIEATTLDPSIDQRNDTVYKNTLFLRDDQLFQTLDAGINAGQHEGGGKSLEIRRFGFNADHGGVNGGLKVLVDDVQQNQGTQGHGQGYLGQLKSLTPELVQDVSILNGPFSAQYGDFSGLGVVHIRLKESLPDQLTMRLQGGSFKTLRTFLAYSPKFKRADSFIAYEGSKTDGPFINPLRYRRDNLTGNYTRHLDANSDLGFKLNLGRNDFFSSGQIPLDEVAAGRLDRFGFVDPYDGGRVRTAILAMYYRRESRSGDTFKLDGFLGRSLFDLYSNFTFFLADPLNGDEIQQHDSRLQEGANAQYLHPYKLFGRQALVTIGGNYQDSQINVGLSKTVRRDPFEAVTSAHARVTNGGGYVQHGLDLQHGHVHLEAGLRFDYFRFDVEDRLDPSLSGTQGAARFQPKFSVAYTPSDNLPATFYLNYGRGISSQDARGVVQKPDSPKVSNTDFYQLGTSHNLKRFSLSTDLFLIDRSNEQVYIPDDGSFELKGPTRSYGFELKTSAKLTRHLSFNGGLTQVSNSFYRGTAPRVYVDSAPHTVANAGLTLNDYHGLIGSLVLRHTGNYRLDGEDARIRASGLDVLDLSLTKRLRRWMDLNLSVDNLTNKRFFETQNYFESRLQTDAPLGFDANENRLIYPSRIHGTPGYPFGITAGLTFRLFEKGK
ncbi:MAG TPA: TonB-dependent receptor [Pyrinomonadaceae bacterium]|nr:TonB-dependent receptor [Pyrinomonadaceae bacterium]